MLSDQLKQAILSSGKTMTEIAAETGVRHRVLSSFLSTDPDTHRDIHLEQIADKLAVYLGLELGPAIAKPKAKDKVMAPAMPAIDWAAAEPKTKRKDEGRERRK